MHIVQVKQDGKLNISKTIQMNFLPRVEKTKRESLTEIIARRKRAERDARLVQIIAR